MMRATIISGFFRRSPWGLGSFWWCLRRGKIGGWWGRICTRIFRWGRRGSIWRCAIRVGWWRRNFRRPFLLSLRISRMGLGRISRPPLWWRRMRRSGRGCRLLAGWGGHGRRRVLTIAGGRWGPRGWGLRGRSRVLPSALILRMWGWGIWRRRMR